MLGATVGLVVGSAMGTLPDDEDGDIALGAKLGEWLGGAVIEVGANDGKEEDWMALGDIVTWAVGATVGVKVGT